MIKIIDRKDKKNKKLFLIPEKTGSMKFAAKYGGDIDGDIYEKTFTEEIFRFPLHL